MNGQCQGRGETCLVENRTAETVGKWCPSSNPQIHPKKHFLELKGQYGLITGVIKLPIGGEVKQYKPRVILWDFPYNNALFGLVL